MLKKAASHNARNRLMLLYKSKNQNKENAQHVCSFYDFADPPSPTRELLSLKLSLHNDL